MRKRKTIQFKLGSTFAAFILALVIVGAVGFYLYGARLTRSHAGDALEQSAKDFSARIDALMESMDRMSMQAVSGEAVANQFYLLRSAYTRGELSVVQQQSRTIGAAMYSLLGAQPAAGRHINIVSADGTYIGTSTATVAKHFPEDVILSAEWISEAIAANGKAICTGVRVSEWTAKQERVFSLVRLMHRRVHTAEAGDAVLEIQQSYEYLSGIVQNEIERGARNAVILSDSGEVIYPYGADAARYADLLLLAPGETTQLRFPGESETYIAVTVRSEISGWTMAVFEAEKTFLEPLQRLRNIVILVGVGLTVLAVALCHMIARQISEPIQSIHERLNQLSLSDLGIEALPESELDELEELNEAFQRTCKRLEDSLSEAVSAHSLEIEARMRALQSQMNPHFIYNTISNIHAIADMDGEEEIKSICEELSKLLRYAMRDSDSLVTLADEMAHTENYLRLMRHRFGDSGLAYTCTIAEEARSIKVPKLILQPLTENCFKHGGARPPVRMRVSVTAEDGVWRAQVEDNGNGFSEEKQRELVTSMERVDVRDPIGDWNAEGIGLMNIYRRLVLLYGAGAQLSIGISELGGASVTLCCTSGAKGGEGKK